MHELMKYLETIHPLSEGCKKYFEKALKSRHLRKGKHLIKPELFATYVFYIKKGLLRSYYKNVDGKEVSIRFVKEKEGAIIIASFFDRKVSQVYIQAVETTDFYYITAEEEEYLFTNFPEYNHVARVILEILLAKTALPKIYLSNLPAAIQRYAYILKWRPDLVSRVPVKYMASYLGMTESTLSKIRGQKIDPAISDALPNPMPD